MADRKNRVLASEAIILQSAISTAVAAFGGKQAGREAATNFKKMLDTLNGAGDPRSLPEPPSSPKTRRGGSRDK